MSDLFYRIFTEDIPLLDVRAPIEFAEGAFPCATNSPLLDDEQRHKVGTQYKKEGKEAAVKLGNRLISGKIKEQRLKNWQAFATRHSNGYLYCFRGGLRSRTTQEWLRQSGIEVPLIKGGYKALRGYLIDQLINRVENSNFVILGGQTGTGKTLLLNQLNNSIDLEGLANHRGSSFGRMLSAQPSQINFENTLAIALLKQHKNGASTIVLEDEGFLIGRISLPKVLHEKMKQVPLVLLEEPVERRIDVIFNDYIISNFQNFKNLYNDEGIEHFKQYLFTSLDRIKKRLGGLRHKNLKNLMHNALEEQLKSNNNSLHKEWIKMLMLEYYDPMYAYQLEKKQSRIVYRGQYEKVLQWFRENN